MIFKMLFKAVEVNNALHSANKMLNYLKILVVVCIVIYGIYLFLSKTIVSFLMCVPVHIKTPQ